MNIGMKWLAGFVVCCVAVAGSGTLMAQEQKTDAVEQTKQGQENKKDNTKRKYVALKFDTTRVYHEVYRHNPDLKLYVMYPYGEKPEKNLPTIVFFFGGGWVSGDVQAFAMQGMYFAQRGMTVVLADYRTKNKYGTTPDACVEDAKSVMRYVKKNADRLKIDTSRLVASGGSAGGHLAAAVALLDGFNAPGDDLSVSPVPTALVLFNPVINNSSEGGYGYDRVKDYYLEFSPYHNIRAGAPPTLFMVGTEDHLIPVSTATAYAEKMKSVGSRCDLELYEGAGHGFFNYNRGPEYFCETLERADEFLVSLGYLEPKK